MFTSILFPTDGSPLSDSVSGKVIQFAQLNHAGIVAINVVQPLPFSPMGDGGVLIDAGVYDTQMHASAQQNLDRIALAAQVAGVPFQAEVATSSSPYEEIIAAAEKFGCDIIVMASHGRSGLSKLFIGSETEKVLGHTALPVLVLHHPTQPS